MIRDRLKNVARRAAVKIFNMEFDVEESEGVRKTATGPGTVTFDPSLIPKVVDGSGDTPGPNHKTEIGRTWTAAQLVAGAAPIFIDIRPPSEVAGGLLPGAILLPGDQVLKQTQRLPDKEQRVTLYDQTGELGSFELAANLRNQGWVMARSLRGGFAEWIEHGEPVHSPQLIPGAKYRVSDPVKLKDGRKGVVQEASVATAGIRYVIWLSDGSTVGPVGEDELAG